MSEYPKHFQKGESRKTATNARQAVELRFNGYKEIQAPPRPMTAPADNHVDVPMLPLTELVEKAEEAGVDVPAEVQSIKTEAETKPKK